MSQEEAFLAAILEAPAEALPRLAYADWLEERGDPRGEAVRVRAALARTPPGDPDRAVLEERWRGLLWEHHRRGWVDFCGLLLTWEALLAVFHLRLAEAVAWCRDREGSLRTPALRPASLLGQFAPPWTPPSTEQRQLIVNDLANRRARLLGRRGPAARDPGGGRLLLFDPDGTLSDGAAGQESGGFLDGDNVPAWDGWVLYMGGGDVPGAGWSAFTSYLVAWVPDRLVGPVGRGVAVNPEECVRWAADVDTALTRRLREAGLLA